MTIAEIIARARRLCYVSSAQYPDATAIEDINIVYKDLTNTITNEVNENFFFDIIKADTIIGQNEYTLDDPTNSIYVNKIKSLYYKD
jgi:hypothetical protein